MLPLFDILTDIDRGDGETIDMFRTSQISRVSFSLDCWNISVNIRVCVIMLMNVATYATMNTVISIPNASDVDSPISLDAAFQN
jgi:hypothetical protein